MRHRKRFFITKSDILFGAALALALWLVNCYLNGDRYTLSCTLEEQIDVSGVVTMPYIGPHDLNFTWNDPRGGSGVISMYRRQYDHQLGGVRYKVSLPGSFAGNSTEGRKWQTPVTRDPADGIVFKLDVPSEWHVKPTQYLIHRPTSNVHFQVARED